MSGRWQVLVPVKQPARAKSRLAAFGERRADLALAMARDTVAAALACPAVGSVTVVTDDDQVGSLLAADGARVVREKGLAGGRGLNAVITAAVATMPGGVETAVLLGDLPALRRDELGRALHLAAALDMAFVPDIDGTGTTLLATRSTALLRPRFGEGSASAHETAGAVRMTGPDLTTVRRDVDDLDDLREAMRLGVGQYTRLLMGELADNDQTDGNRARDARLEDRRTWP